MAEFQPIIDIIFYIYSFAYIYKYLVYLNHYESEKEMKQIFDIN